MLFTTVNSTTLAAIAYDPALQTLHIRFRTGALYCYFGVPQNVYASLMAADSKGNYFNRYIRGQFLFRKLK